MILES